MADGYTIEYVPPITVHLQAIEKKYWAMIRAVLAEQFSFEPAVATRNRKPMIRRNRLDATWELRFGPNNRFCDYYDVDDVDKRVEILALGVKRRNRLWIAGREFVL